MSAAAPAGPVPYNEAWPGGRLSGAESGAAAATPPAPRTTPQDLEGLF